MKEKRKYNRIQIPLPVKLEVISSGNEKVLDLITKDISASGTYIGALTTFPENTRVKLDFTLPTDNVEKFESMDNLKRCTDRMVRSTHHGFAIQFDKECQIDSLKTL